MQFETQTTLIFFPYFFIIGIIAYFTVKYFKAFKHNTSHAPQLIVPHSIDELAGPHAPICTTDRCTIITKSDRSSLTRQTRYVFDDGRLIIVNGSGDVGEYAPKIGRVNLEKHEREAFAACEVAMKHARVVATQISPQYSSSAVVQQLA